MMWLRGALTLQPAEPDLDYASGGIESDWPPPRGRSIIHFLDLEE